VGRNSEGVIKQVTPEGCKVLINGELSMLPIDAIEPVVPRKKDFVKIINEI